MGKGRFSGRLAVWLKIQLIKMKNADKKLKLGRGCNIGFNSVFEGCNAVADEAEFSGSLGFGSYIGKRSSVTAEVGRYSCIGPNVQTIYGNHPTDQFVAKYASEEY